MHWIAAYPLRILNALGCVLIYCALFLYEDREGKIQNVIEDWWVRLDDARIAASSWVAAFVQGVARLTLHGFERVLGEKLLSFRFAGVSFCLSIASFFLIAFFGAVRAHRSFAAPLFWAATWVAVGLVPGFDTRKWVAKVWGVCLLVWLMLQATGGFLFFVYFTRGGVFLARGLSYAVLAFLVSFAGDVSYVALTRWMLRRVSAGRLGYAVLLMVAVNLLVLCVLLLGPISLGLWVSRYWQRGGASIFLSFCLNAIDFFAGSAALFIALALLAHRLLWPFLQRPLYALQRYEVIRKKKLLWAAGLALAFVPTRMTFSLLETLVRKL